MASGNSRKPDPSYWPPFPSYEDADVDKYDPKILKTLDIEHVMELLTTKLYRLNENPPAMIQNILRILQTKALVMPVGRHDQTSSSWNVRSSELSNHQVKQQYERMVDHLLDNLQKMNDCKIGEMRTAFKAYLKAELGNDANAISLDHTASHSGNGFDSKAANIVHDADNNGSESDSGNILTPESSDAGENHAEKALPRIPSWTEEAQITHDFEAARKEMVDTDKYDHFKQSFLRNCEKLYDSDPHRKQIRVRTLPNCSVKPKLEPYVPTAQSHLKEQNSTHTDSSRSTDGSTSSISSCKSGLEISNTRNSLARIFGGRESLSNTEIKDRLAKLIAQTLQVRRGASGSSTQPSPPSPRKLPEVIPDEVGVQSKIESANSVWEAYANDLINNSVTVSEDHTEVAKDCQETLPKTTIASPKLSVSVNMQYCKAPKFQAPTESSNFTHMDSWDIMHHLQLSHGLDSEELVDAMVVSPGGRIVCALAKQDLAIVRKITRHLVRNDVITGELNDLLYEKFKVDMFPVKEDELCRLYTWINNMQAEGGIRNDDGGNTSDTMRDVPKLRAQAGAVVCATPDSEFKHVGSHGNISGWGMSESNLTTDEHDQNNKNLPVLQDTDRVDKATLTKAEIDIFNVVKQKLQYDDGHKTFVQMSNTAGGKIISTVVNQDSSAARDIVLGLRRIDVLTIPQHDKILNRLHYGKPIDYNELAHIYTWVNSLEDKARQNKALQVEAEIQSDEEISGMDDFSEKEIKETTVLAEDVTAMTQFEFSRFLKIHGHLCSYSRTNIWKMALTLGGTFVRCVINGQTAKAYLVVFSIRDHTTEIEHEILRQQISKTPHDYVELARAYEMINELATLKKLTLAELQESFEEPVEESLD